MTSKKVLILHHVYLQKYKFKTVKKYNRFFSITFTKANIELTYFFFKYQIAQTDKCILHSFST